MCLAGILRRIRCQTPPGSKNPGKLANSFFFWTQLNMRQWFADETEFANRGKLTWQTGNLNGRLGQGERTRAAELLRRIGYG